MIRSLLQAASAGLPQPSNITTLSLAFIVNMASVADTESDGRTALGTDILAPLLATEIRRLVRVAWQCPGTVNAVNLLPPEELLRRAASVTVRWQRIRRWYQIQEAKSGEKCPQRGLDRTHWKTDEYVFRLVNRGVISIPDDQSAGSSEHSSMAALGPSCTEGTPEVSSPSAETLQDTPRVPHKDISNPTSDLLSRNNVDGCANSLTSLSLRDIGVRLSGPMAQSSPAPIPPPSRAHSERPSPVLPQSSAAPIPPPSESRAHSERPSPVLPQSSHTQIPPPSESRAHSERPSPVLPQSSPAPIPPPSESRAHSEQPSPVLPQSSPAPIPPPSESRAHSERPSPVLPQSSPAPIPPPSEFRAHSERPSPVLPQSSPAPIPPPSESRAHSEQPSPVLPQSSPAPIPPPSESRAHSERPSLVLPQSSPAPIPPPLPDEDVIMHLYDDEAPDAGLPTVAATAILQTGADRVGPPNSSSLPVLQSKTASRDSLSPQRPYKRRTAPARAASRRTKCRADSEFDLTQLDPRLYLALQACQFFDDDYDASSRASSPTSESESEESEMDSPVSDDLVINSKSGIYRHRKAIRAAQLLKAEQRHPAVVNHTPPERDLNALKNAWPGLEKLGGRGKVVAMGVDHREPDVDEGTPVLYVFNDVEMFFYPAEERTTIQASTLVKLLKDTVKVPHVGVYFSLQHIVNGRHSYEHLAYLNDLHELQLMGEDRPVDLELLDPKKTSQSARLKGVYFAAFYHVVLVFPRDKRRRAESDPEEVLIQNSTQSRHRTRTTASRSQKGKTPRIRYTPQQKLAQMVAWLKTAQNGRFMKLPEIQEMHEDDENDINKYGPQPIRRLLRWFDVTHMLLNLGRVDQTAGPAAAGQLITHKAVAKFLDRGHDWVTHSKTCRSAIQSGKPAVKAIMKKLLDANEPIGADSLAKVLKEASSEGCDNTKTHITKKRRVNHPTPASELDDDFNSPPHSQHTAHPITPKSRPVPVAHNPARKPAVPKPVPKRVPRSTPLTASMSESTVPSGISSTAASKKSSFTNSNFGFRKRRQNLSESEMDDSSDEERPRDGFEMEDDHEEESGQVYPDNGSSVVGDIEDEDDTNLHESSYESSPISSSPQEPDDDISDPMMYSRLDWRATSEENPSSSDDEGDNFARSDQINKTDLQQRSPHGRTELQGDEGSARADSPDYPEPQMPRPRPRYRGLSALSATTAPLSSRPRVAELQDGPLAGPTGLSAEGGVIPPQNVAHRVEWRSVQMGKFRIEIPK
ncbi:hypothetical protein C8Q76DRAFT_697898 [Earliella scabrosa]|nr:hypothetical protein C8Q76DRAFT_697898 [Earliella scabrosa]